MRHLQGSRLKSGAYRHISPCWFCRHFGRGHPGTGRDHPGKADGNGGLDPFQASLAPGFHPDKLLSNIIGALVFIVLVPGLVAWILNYLATHTGVPLATFLAGAGIIMLGLIFYISLVILLGVLFESRGPVLGIAFGILIGGMMLRNFIPPILYVLPLSMDGVGMAVLMGMPCRPLWSRR